MRRCLKSGKASGDLQALGISGDWRILFSDWWGKTPWPSCGDAPVWQSYLFHTQISAGLLRLLYSWHVWRVERIYRASSTVRTNTIQLFVLATSCCVWTWPSEKQCWFRIIVKIGIAPELAIKKPQDISQTQTWCWDQPTEIHSYTAFCESIDYRQEVKKKNKVYIVKKVWYN